MKAREFEIYIPAYSSSVAEWRKAQQAPPSELPELTPQQKEVARKFGITEQEYARTALAGQYGRQKMRDRAQALGEAVQQILGGDKRVTAVFYDMDRVAWVVRIETPRKDVDVLVSRELADDLFDSSRREELERLRARVVSTLDDELTKTR